MIIASLTGGLGNQLFEYAAGRALAEKHAAQLKLDTYSLDRSFRKYALDNFHIRAEKATTRDILRLDGVEGLLRALGPHAHSASNRLARAFKRVRFRSRYYDACDPGAPSPPLLLNRVASQRIFHFDDDFFQLPDDVVLIGTWISYKYFQHIRGLLLEEISVRHGLAGRNEEAARRITDTQSVSVHVRRTDKVNDPEYFVTDLNYLNKSMSLLRERLGHAAFYVFSDDIDWCRTNLGRDDVAFVDWNGDAQAHEDLRLMSLCKHNIIAESSFSWWGGYLNQNPSKIVITPPASRWIRKANFSCRDILPPEWHVLDEF